jgi:hypothetical protein
MGAYLGSKLLVLGMLTAAEAVLFALLGLLGRNGLESSVLLASGRIEIVIAVVMVTVTSMVVGLVISAWIGNADLAMPLLVPAVMLQLILAGALFPVQGRAVLEQLSWLVPAQWAYAMGISTANLSLPATSALWRHDPLIWIADASALAALAITLVIVTGLLLRRIDPQRVRT